jgi:hypothetical protein
MAAVLAAPGLLRHPPACPERACANHEARSSPARTRRARSQFTQSSPPPSASWGGGRGGRAWASCATGTAKPRGAGAGRADPSSAGKYIAVRIFLAMSWFLTSTMRRSGDWHFAQQDALADSLDELLDVLLALHRQGLPAAEASAHLRAAVDHPARVRRETAGSDGPHLHGLLGNRSEAVVLSGRAVWRP